MSNILIQWRPEKQSLIGFVRIPAIADMTVPDPPIFEIKQLDANHFQVCTVADGAEVGTVWRSISAAKRLALTHLYQQILSLYGHSQEEKSTTVGRPRRRTTHQRRQ